jgi:hypothetical protein
MGWIPKEKFEKTSKEIQNIINNNEITCFCGYIFKSENLRHTFDKYDETYWIYARCPNCSYDLNYEKIQTQHKRNNHVFLS